MNSNSKVNLINSENNKEADIVEMPDEFAKLERVKPLEIEARSFEIITKELGDRTFPKWQEAVVKRVIHTSADFDYADNMAFSNEATLIGLEAIKNGAIIITDTTMAMAGINKKTLAKYGAEVRCFIADEDVAKEAVDRGLTRSAVCMEKAARLQKETSRPMIFAIGNAPTALVSLYELIKKGELKPALIIGVPVGFVNVVQSKELIMTAGVPYIVAKGRKGGSNVAAAIVNGILRTE